MRILLINPSIATEKVYSSYSFAAPTLPPLGLCYLASVLLKNEQEVKIVDCIAENITLSQLKNKIKNYSPQIVGITSTTISYLSAREVIKISKNVDEKIITIMGGPHISALPFQTMKECKELDIGVIGEGEYTLLEIVKNLENNNSLIAVKCVKGTILREGDRIVNNSLNEARGPIKNVDQIPFPARHLLKNLKIYSHTPLRKGQGLTTTMITSRGCPFNCYYCDQSVFGRHWRAFSADYVVSEISHLINNYGVDYISFEDDNFIISRGRSYEICKKMSEKQLNINWGCSLRVNMLDKDILSIMKKAGCRNIYIGIESGAPRILKLINKKIKIEDVKKGVKLIKKAGINVYGSFMIGVPTETKEDIEKTIEFATSLHLDGVSFFLYTPFPNTKLSEIAPKYGKINEKWDSYAGHSNEVPYLPDGISEEYLLKIQKDAYSRFYFRIGYILRHLNRLFDPNFVKNSIAAIKIFMRDNKPKEGDI